MTYYNLYGHALGQEPLSGHEITILVDLSIVIVTVFSLTDLCLEVEKKISTKNNAFSLYDIWSRPRTRTPTPKVIKFYNFGRTFFGHHYFISILSDLCS